MRLQRITVESELKDGQTYLCCRTSRHGNAIWETLEAQKHQLLYNGLKMPMSSYAKVYDLPKTVAEIDDSTDPATRR